MLNRLNIGKRLGLGFGALILLMVLVSGTTFLLNQRKTALLAAFRGNQERAHLASEMGMAADRIEQDVLKSVIALTPAQRETIQADLNRNRTAYQEKYQQLLASVTTEVSRQQLRQIEEIRQRALAFN